MTTALMQVAAAALTLVFAAFARAIARQHGGITYVQRAAWIVVAVFFLWRAIPGVLQSLVMLRAAEAGPGSREFALVVQWTPAMNYLRTLIAVAMGWTLAALPLLRGQRLGRVWWGTSLACLLLAATGVYAGWLEGPTSRAHLVALTVLGAAELIGVLAGLTVGLIGNTLDRYLWIILGMYGVQVALNVMWYSSTAGFFYPGGWYPLPPLRYVYSFVVLLAACGLARQRLALARRGARVGGLMEIAGPGMVQAQRSRGF